VVGVENHENVERTLADAKRMFELRPIIVTTDLSPNMIAPVRRVFGEEVVQIDGFHVMQELNKSIRRDLLDFKYREFKAPIRALNAFRRWIKTIQNKIQNAPATVSREIKKGPPINNTHPVITDCRTITKLILQPLTLTDPKKFKERLEKLLKRLKRDSRNSIQALVKALTEKMPKRPLTKKGMKRLQIELLKRIKKIYLEERTKLEAARSQFHKDHWILFFQPEKMTETRTTRLQEFLTKYPQTKEYHELTRQVGSIYRKPVELIDGTEIDNLTIKPYYSEQLQTTLKTLKKFKQEILRFKNVFQANPHLSKACRANMEYYNQRFKAPFQNGLNCTKPTHLLAKLTLQLGCKVRFFVEETTKEKEHKKLNV